MDDSEQGLTRLGEEMKAKVLRFVARLRECTRTHSRDTNGPAIQKNISRICQDQARLQEVRCGIESLMQENDPFRFIEAYKTTGKQELFVSYFTLYNLLLKYWLEQFSGQLSDLEEEEEQEDNEEEAAEEEDDDDDDDDLDDSSVEEMRSEGEEEEDDEDDEDEGHDQSELADDLYSPGEEEDEEGEDEEEEEDEDGEEEDEEERGV
ncbi:hypothetical protein L3Q82_003987 [Scortum barcoo]|uniref:Uncharacterized protein n=1 Tax=Scortum barcoo TaxID=214431 RepID=A0ACB8X6R0_9TELE|nr:hypothetical protein L3Q82_003987 [Scortum barcoo]